MRGFPGGASGKEPTCQFRRHKRRGLITGLRRSSGVGNGNPLQSFCLENPLDRLVTASYQGKSLKKKKKTMKIKQICQLECCRSARVLEKSLKRKRTNGHRREVRSESRVRGRRSQRRVESLEGTLKVGHRAWPREVKQ